MPSRLQSTLPLVWGAIAVLAVAVLLPTALRPPPDEANASAEFSPDAPPDESPDVIIQTLEQARSQTAGGLQEVVTTTTTPPPPPPPPREVLTKGGCLGDPARQVESAYAGPCRELWAGENGGATSKGVDADEIRVIVWTQTGGGGSGGTRGRVPHTAQPDESADDRTNRVFQQYFNENFEFYGRRMQLIIDTSPGATNPTKYDPAQTRAHVIGSDEEWGGIFATFTENIVALQTAAEIGTVAFGGIQLTEQLYEENAPYMYSWWMDGDQLGRLNAEYICKRLANQPAQWAGTPDLRAQTRKFGIMWSDTAGQTNFDKLGELIKDRCGLDTISRRVPPPGDDPQSLGLTLAAFRAEAVTSIVLGSDPISPALFMPLYDEAGYYPEWIIAGFWHTDQPAAVGLYPRSQMQNAFGISSLEWYYDRGDLDSFRAYKSIDPAGTPDSAQADFLFPVLMQIANGIQGAGPNLNPDTFVEGLHLTTVRPKEPGRFACCGYHPGRGGKTYADAITEVYYDSSIPNPGVRGAVGNLVYPTCGERWLEGEIPNEPLTYAFEGACIRPRGGREAGPAPRPDPGF